MKYILFSACTFLLSISAQATSLSYNFASSAGSQSGSGFSNVRTYTSGGITVTVTAFGLTGNGDTTLQNANVGQYSGWGLGVCNQNEKLNCGSPNHQVDDANGYDFVLFQFSSLVNPTAITIRPYGTFDRDVTYYTGDVAGALSLNGVALSDLSALGLTNVQNSDSTVSSSSRVVSLTSGTVNTILFGARVGGDSSADYFKIAGLTASTPVNPTPEPASFLLAGAALIALGALRRR